MKRHVKKMVLPALIALMVAVPVGVVYACCGMDPIITDDPIPPPIFVGEEVTISGTVEAYEEWADSYSTDLEMTIVVQPPTGDPVPLDVTLTLVVDADPYAKYTFSATYTPQEVGQYTYEKTAMWTTWYDTMTRTASGTFEVEQLPEGKVTGGGWIELPGEGKKKPKDTFGFVAKYEEGEEGPTGNLEFQAHADKMNVKSVAITQLTVIGNTATFSGPCTVSGEEGFTFVVTVEDNGEPGKGTDKFGITVSGPTGFAIPLRIIDGGNIQVHEQNEEP